MAVTYGQLALDVAAALRKIGVTQPGLEARLLVAHASGKGRDALLRDSRLYVSTEIEQTARQYLQRRLEGEPVAYIVGGWEFMGRAFAVTSDVLIPRPDTETLCLAAGALLQHAAAPRVLDLCCGSGCIGLSLAAEHAAATVVLGDISPAALSVARQNSRLHRLTLRVSAVQVDALQPLPETLGQFDLVVSNPPYIPTADVDTLDHSVRGFEPRVALDGGADGLDFYRSISVNIKSSLKQGGHLLFEVGFDQADAVADIVRAGGFSEVDIISDLGGIQRVVKCTLAEQPFL